MQRFHPLFIVLICLLTVLGVRLAKGVVLVNVPATSNPWLAGTPNGTTDTGPDGTDVAPDESPIQVTGFSLTAGLKVTFSASGQASWDGTDPLFGPDGNQTVIIHHTEGALNGIADITAPLSSLIGVFLSSSSPIGSIPPAGFDFSTLVSQSQTLLAPALDQPFFIGDGYTSASIPQQFVVPSGASRLFLGVMDGNQWNNNRGAFSVNVDVPEPQSLLTVGAGMLGLAVYLRRPRGGALADLSGRNRKR